MTLPTVAQLCRSLPADLQPAPDVLAPEVPITAVHVSDLADPSPYLSGGELLLSTGLSLPENVLGIHRFVGQLLDVDVAALGLGLGPHLQEVPAPLQRECARVGLTLLVVPAESAFLTVTKEYWAARTRSSQQHLTYALSAHSDLVNAMVSPDPTAAALRSLSAAVGAWSALLDESAHVQHVFPAGRAHDAVELSDRLVRSQAAGTTTITTLPIGDEVAVVFPLVVGDRVRGHLALGSATALGPNARRLAITTTALLSIDSVQRYRADAAAQTRRAALATLLDIGHLDAARRLGERFGTLVPDSVRVLQMRTDLESDATEVVLRWCPEAWAAAKPQRSRASSPSQVWFVIPLTVRDLSELAERLQRVDPTASAILSDATPADQVHLVRLGAADRLENLPPGTFQGPVRPRATSVVWEPGLERVMQYHRADLTTTLAAHLRHRGQGEAAARDLGLHRNTLRYRMDRIRQLMGCDVDDPDVASEIWLHLRSIGRA